MRFNPLYRYRFQQYRLFWISRKIFINLCFLFARFLFARKSQIDQKRLQFHVLFSITRISFVSFVLSCLSTYLINRYGDNFDYLLLGKTEKLDPIDPSNYTSFVGTVAGVSGVFVGLYYAAICSIVSSIYSRVTSSIRSLIVEEIVGTVYVFLLSYTSAISVLLLAMNSMGCSPRYAGVIYLSFCAVITIASFIKLGFRAFEFFDPNYFLVVINRKVASHIKQVTSGSWLSSEPSFQKHHNNCVASEIDSIYELFKVISTESKIKSESLKRFMVGIVELLCYYANQKPKIYIDSKWYPPVWRHRSWYFASSSELEIAIKSGTQITPFEKKNLSWFEDELIEICIEAIRDCSIVNPNATAYIVNRVKSYCVLESRNHNPEKSLQIVRQILIALVDTLESQEYGRDEELKVLGIFEVLVNTFLEIALNYWEVTLEVTRDSCSDLIASIDFTNRRTLYSKSIPIHLLKQLEWFFLTQTNETPTQEGATPLWYKTDLLLLEESRHFSKSLNVTSIGVMENLISCQKKLKEKNYFWLSASMLSRILEFEFKWSYRKKKLFEKIDVITRKAILKDLEWANVDEKEISSRVEMLYDEVLAEISPLCLHLEVKDRSEEYPDYSGQFLNVMSNSILNSLEVDDHERIDLVFEAFFNASLLAFENLRRKIDVRKRSGMNRFRMASATVLELMEISGISILASEIHLNPMLKSKILKIWDDYFDRQESDGRLELLNSLIQIKDNSLGLFSRDILVTSWRMRIEKLFDGFDREQGRHFTVQKVKHRSPLVVNLGGDGHFVSVNGIDLFVYYYLKEKDIASKLKFGGRYDRYQDIELVV